ncbi:MAG: radical SAM protein [Aromatoleum sp.]|jgi:wyosine [tRNA(Phe)-imidazoG37] synthetase (radical SAM superfamily)|uniref:radical SAM protein n=1 Tax=Aromatoleum sp. TaxID=2307007 RepID=UPI00289525B5|nr:radical SAM protein [Aromatoleum sp.]MDT3669533.1 radical SAM protein [Aromatoleum sp.]
MVSRDSVLNVRNHDRDFAGMTYVYPVLSRRAGGVSVGINLNPNNACNWHCAYCQVPDLVRGKAPAIDLAQLEAELSGFLRALVHGDYLERHVPEGLRTIRDIAFSGNGEPTSAAEFPEVIALVGRLRNEFGLGAGVPMRLITNGSLMGQPRVQEAVRALGDAGGEVWFKVDAGTKASIERINGVSLDPATVARNLAISAALCPTWVQTCMFRWDGAAPTNDDIEAYLDVLEAAGADHLRGVLLYGIARPSMQPEAVRLSPLTAVELEAIAATIAKKGLTVRVSP